MNTKNSTNWQVRLDPKLSLLVRKKAKLENRSINKTIILILEIYFGLKEEKARTILVVDDLQT